MSVNLQETIFKKAVQSTTATMIAAGKKFNDVELKEIKGKCFERLTKNIPTIP